MASFYLDTEFAHGMLDNIQESQQTLMLSLENLNEKFQNLESRWIAPDASKYFERYDSWRRGARALVEDLEKFRSDLDEAIVEWENCD